MSPVNDSGPAGVISSKPDKWIYIDVGTDEGLVPADFIRIGGKPVGIYRAKNIKYHLKMKDRLQTG